MFRLTDGGYELLKGTEAEQPPILIAGYKKEEE
jgi:hypothetical protein